MVYETIEVKQEGGIAWLTLNRPESLNAMNPQLVNEVRDFFGGLPEDKQTRVVVMRGAGRAFCAGLDLKSPAGGPGIVTKPVGPIKILPSFSVSINVKS